MDDRKVYNMPVGMENQHVAEDSEDRLCMSMVRKAGKSKAKKAIEKATLFLIKIVFSTAVSVLVGEWAITSAYEERGYRAIGGEYLLIAMVFGVSFMAANILIKKHRRVE